MKPGTPYYIAAGAIEVVFLTVLVLSSGNAFGDSDLLVSALCGIVAGCLGAHGYRMNRGATS